MQAVRIFLDDSGQKEYGPATSRYFVYAGPIVETANEAEVSERFAELKNRVFGDPTVEIKSNWMRQPQERRRRDQPAHCDLSGDRRGGWPPHFSAGGS